MRKFVVGPIGNPGGFNPRATIVEGSTVVGEAYFSTGNEGFPSALYGAERIAAALNTIEGIYTYALDGIATGDQPLSLASLRETLRDMVQQFHNNDTEGLAESMALVDGYVTRLSGE